MESDSDVDMSWVELVAAEREPPKRPPPTGPKSETVQSKGNGRVGSISAGGNGTPLRSVVVKVKEPGTIPSEEGENETKEITTSEGRCICIACWHEELTPLMGSGRQSCLSFNRGRLVYRDSDTRPWSQPPMFDYERFSKEFVPSDKMIVEMFPNDPAKRTAYRDAQTEFELLNMFSDWAVEIKDVEVRHCRNASCSGCFFHQDLTAELRIDQQDAGREFDVIKQSLTELQTWQKTYMDMDGEFTFARKELDRGRNIFHGPGGQQARARYGPRLEPIPDDTVSSWELLHLDDSRGGTEKVVERLKGGKELFEPCFFGRVRGES